MRAVEVKKGDDIGNDKYSLVDTASLFCRGFLFFSPVRDSTAGSGLPARQSVLFCHDLFFFEPDYPYQRGGLIRFYLQDDRFKEGNSAERRIAMHPFLEENAPI